MTTTVIVKAHPAKTSDGRDLEVSVKGIDIKADGSESKAYEYFLEAGQEGQYTAYEGRKVIVEEVPKSS